jgi:hypothetical protein
LIDGSSEFSAGIDGSPLICAQNADVHDQEGGKKKGQIAIEPKLRRVCFSPLWVDVAFDNYNPLK